MLLWFECLYNLCLPWLQCVNSAICLKKIFRFGFSPLLTFQWGQFSGCLNSLWLLTDRIFSNFLNFHPRGAQSPRPPPLPRNFFIPLYSSFPFIFLCLQTRELEITSIYRFPVEQCTGTHVFFTCSTSALSAARESRSHSFIHPFFRPLNLTPSLPIPSPDTHERLSLTCNAQKEGVRVSYDPITSSWSPRHLIPSSLVLS